MPVRCSVGVLGNEKSTGDGGGAGVSSMLLPEREELALNAALTSWPKVLWVRRERRWRGLEGVGCWTGIVDVGGWYRGLIGLKCGGMLLKVDFCKVMDGMKRRGLRGLCVPVVRRFIIENLLSLDL